MMTKRLLILLMILIVACGGTAASTTSAETDETTTTTATSTTDDETNATVDLADMPQECIDAFVAFLQAIEPVVSDVDFQNSTIADMEAMGTELEAATAGPTAEMDSLNCPDIDATDEEAFAAMIDIAEREAPGTVAYFRWIETFATSEGSGAGVSGDCETDIAALESLIADNENMGELTLSELTEFGQLMGAITTPGGECTDDRVEDFLAQPEIDAFMSSGS